ncbi:MAG: nucleoside deaminase [Thomasclavelia sp.]|nr:nucleoside deaminase [Thomasclavelia sp.]
MNQDELYMEEAYKEALKAYQKDEVPIGCVIVYNDEIIVRSHNLRENNQCATSHAEIVAIEKACKILHNWHLDDCILYVTLEPCLMCSGAIVNSRIKKVVYGSEDLRWAGLSNVVKDYDKKINHHPEVIGGVLEDKCTALLKQYFKSKREK